ncbi:MAG: nucleotidyltransferase domain-containing protein [Deltaproteobacteria bacterium]|jgi:predicted nucleotidyltransferase|nr:nucleotidyltransferase domain-containing protein [Deltaproteobacteria bacterium]
MIYTINEIKNKITPVAIKYNLAAVYIFGSYARGEATANSDVDILIDRTGATLGGFFAFGGLLCDFEEALGKPIDLITTYSLRQRRMKKKIALVYRTY